MLPEARALLEQVERCERLFQTPRLEVELDDVSGLDSDLEIGGPYLAATFRF